MAWEQADYESYHEDRLTTDTLLQNLQLDHGDFVLSDQIDTLRNLLEDKETHLSIEMRFRRGIFLTPPLLGYDQDENGNLVINPHEAKIVQLIF